MKKYLKTEAGSFSYLCSVLKSAKMCLLDIKLFSTSRTFRLSKGSIYFFSFSCWERKRGREIGFNKRSWSLPMATHHLSWPTFDYNILIPSCTLLITATRNKSYLRKDTQWFSTHGSEGWGEEKCGGRKKGSTIEHMVLSPFFLMWVPLDVLKC